MKSRKFPIALTAVLVVALGGAIAMNFKPKDGPADTGHEPGSEVTGEARESGTVGELATLAREQAKGKNERAAPQGDELSTTEPAILLPDVEEYKPAPNPTSTSAQWYDKDSQHSGH